MVYNNTQGLEENDFVIAWSIFMQDTICPDFQIINKQKTKTKQQQQQ